MGPTTQPGSSGKPGMELELLRFPLGQYSGRPSGAEEGAQLSEMFGVSYTKPQQQNQGGFITGFC